MRRRRQWSEPTGPTVEQGRALVARLAGLAPAVAGAEYPGPTPVADAVDRALRAMASPAVAGPPDLLGLPDQWAAWAHRAPRAAWRAVQRAARIVAGAARRAARSAAEPVRAVGRELAAWSAQARATADAAVRRLADAAARGGEAVWSGLGLGLAIGIPLLLYAMGD